MTRYRVIKMSFLSWRDLEDNTHPLAPIAELHVAAFCSLRQADPWLFTSRLADELRPNFNNAPERFWERICQPRDAPPVVDRPFGGQCAGVLYDLQLYDPNGIEIAWFNTGGGGAIVGPITEVTFQLIEPEPNNPDIYRAIACSFRNEAGQIRNRGGGNPTGAYIYDAFWRVQLFRTDGLSIACDPPPPPPPPVDPPTLPVDIDVTINNVTTNFPVVFPEFVINDWPDFNFSPVIELGGIRGEVTLGGINFPDFNFPDWPEIPPIEVNLTPTLNAIANLDAVLQIGLGNININIDGIRGAGDVDLTEVLELIRCCACEEGTEYVSENVTGVTAGGLFPLPAGCVAVVVSAVLPFTPKTPTISRSGGEPDVYLWGTYAIGYTDGAAGTVERLSYDYQAIAASEAAATIVVTPHYGNACTIDAIIKTRNC